MKEDREQRAMDAASDSEDEEDPSVRRGLLDEFRRRYRFSIPMRQQCTDRVCAEILTFFLTRRLKPSTLKLHAERMFACFPLKDIIVVLDQDKSNGCVWYPDGYQTMVPRGRFTRKGGF